MSLQEQLVHILFRSFGIRKRQVYKQLVMARGLASRGHLVASCHRERSVNCHRERSAAIC